MEFNRIKISIIIDIRINSYQTVKTQQHHKEKNHQMKNTHTALMVHLKVVKGQLKIVKYQSNNSCNHHLQKTKVIIVMKNLKYKTKERIHPKKSMEAKQQLMDNPLILFEDFDLNRNGKLNQKEFANMLHKIYISDDIKDNDDDNLFNIQIQKTFKHMDHIMEQFTVNAENTSKKNMKWLK
eukprot:477194_1